jgi:D-aminopeptidase
MAHDPVVAALDALFAPWNRGDQPGLVVGVQHHGRPLYRRAFGMASLETGQANSVSTRMRIGSTSKHILAQLVVLLQQDGVLDLDRPIGVYLPELDGGNAEPTLRQLLQHRGGTRCHIDLGFIGHGMLAPPEGSALAMLRRQRGRNFPLGTAMIYNNGGYHLVSQAACRMTGETLAALLDRYLFGPLAMHATQLVPSDYVMTPGMASLHLPGNGPWRRGLFPSHEVLGEGGIVSTIDDMLTWARYLRRTWDPLLAFPPEADGRPGYYGLGLMQRTYRGVYTLRHAGGVVGGSSDMLCIPGHALDIVVLANGAPGAVPPILVDRVADIVLGDSLEAPASPPDVHEYREWLGHYGSSETGMVYSLEEQGGALCLRIAQYASVSPLERASDGRLSTGPNGVGTIDIDCGQGTDGALSAGIAFAGQHHIFAKLGTDGAAWPPALIEGRFVSEESGLEAAIEWIAGRPVLGMRDTWGSTSFDLSPLGGSWLAMRSRPDPDQFGATVWFPNGWRGGFTLNSARTRNLQFHRRQA